MDRRGASFAGLVVLSGRTSSVLGRDLHGCAAGPDPDGEPSTSRAAARSASRGHGYLGGRAGELQRRGTHARAPRREAPPGRGGSHAGVGGAGTGTPATTYGSVFDPRTSGSGGGAGNPGDNGGGLLVMHAGTVVLDGSILATGSGPASVGGAGGSINLDLDDALGQGHDQRVRQLRRNGDRRRRPRLGPLHGHLRLRPDTHRRGGRRRRLERRGGHGLPEVAAQTYGELVVDNAGLDGAATPVASIGFGTVTGVAGRPSRNRSDRGTSRSRSSACTSRSPVAPR